MKKIYPVLGCSMRFLFEPGDRAMVAYCRPGDLRSGDIALLLRWEGGVPKGYVIHRVTGRSGSAAGQTLITRGDALFRPDKPAAAFQPVGRVSALLKDNGWVDTAGLNVVKYWRFFSFYSLLAGNALGLFALTARYCQWAAHHFICRPLGRFHTPSRLLNYAAIVFESGLYPGLYGFFSGLYFSADRAALAAGRPSGGAAAGGPEIKSGRIKADQVWRGQILVRDYLVVEKGAKVCVAPGTVITFERADPWFIPVARSSGGRFAELDSFHSKILVYGGFAVSGGKDAGVIIKAAGFGGIHYLGGASGHIRHLTVEGSPGCALSAWDRASLTIEYSSVRACRSGVELHGAASALISDTDFDGVSGTVVSACDGTRVVMIRTGFSASGAAAGFSGPVIGDIRDPIFEGNGAGLLMKGGGSVRITGGRISGSKGPAAALSSGAVLECDGTEFSGNGAGLVMETAAFARMKGARFDGNKGPAAALSSGAVLECEGAVFEKNGDGLIIKDRGAARLTDSIFKDNGGYPLSATGRCRAALKDCRFTANGFGCKFSKKSRLSLENCAFEMNLGPAIKLETGSIAAVSGLRAGGAQSAVVLSGGSQLVCANSYFETSAGPLVAVKGRSSFCAEKCEFTSEGDAVFADEAGHISLYDSSLRSVKASAAVICAERFTASGISTAGHGGITLKRGTGELRDVSIHAHSYALISSASRLRMRNIRTRGGTDGGIELRAGVNDIDGVSLQSSPFPGLTMSCGARLSSIGVSFDGGPWTPPEAKKPVASAARSAAAAFAARTAGFFPFCFIYGALYRLAVAVARRWLFFGPAGTLYLHRGLVSGDWVAGLSDIDLQLILDRRAPDEESGFGFEFFRRRARLKKVFPFLGEALMAEEGEFRDLMALGGVKAAEFRFSARVLRGRGLELAPAGSVGVASSDVAEAFYAYTLLMKNMFDRAGSPGIARMRNIYKARADVERCLASSDPASRRLSRREYIGTKDGASASAFRAFAALHTFSSASLGSRPFAPTLAGFELVSAPVPSCADVSFNQRKFEEAAAELSVAGLRPACVLESLYRFYVIVPDGAAAEPMRFSALCGKLAGVRSRYSFLAATPMVLTRSAFEFLSCSSYQNNPMFWHELRSGGPVTSDHLLPREAAVHRANLDLAAGYPDPAALLENAILSFRHFSYYWRGLFEELPAHYLYSRLMGLRLLLEKRIAAPFGDTVFLREIYAREFGDTRGPLFRNGFLKEKTRYDYEFILGQIRELRGYLERK